ncbi:hypothetical protein G7046_g1742 [Stylonectria norvegica]|nr:hypothetical protein G7046_g1742 [Stylonectria norvegica]
MDISPPTSSGRTSAEVTSANLARVDSRLVDASRLRNLPSRGRGGRYLLRSVSSQGKLSYRSEATPATFRRSSSSHICHGMNSCPELGRVPKHPSELTPTSDTSRNSFSQRNTRPQLLTPTSLRSRLTTRLRRLGRWTSSTGSSRSNLPISSPDSDGQPRFRNSRERRRRARDTEVHLGSLDIDDKISPGSEGTSPLAMAGAMLAASDLDRLSLMARKDEQSRGQARVRREDEVVVRRHDAVLDREGS